MDPALRVRVFVALVDRLIRPSSRTVRNVAVADPRPPAPTPGIPKRREPTEPRNGSPFAQLAPVGCQ